MNNLSTLYLLVWMKMSRERSWTFVLSRDWKLHIYITFGHGGRIKVGVKLKNNFQRKKSFKKGQTYVLCCPKEFIQLNMGRKKIYQTRVCKKTTMVVCATFDDRRCSNWAFEDWGDFRSEKIYFEKFSKTKVVSITFRLRQIHGHSLKEVDCSNSNATHHF